MGFFFKRARIDPSDDIFDLLKNDHRGVKQLFDEIQGRAEDDEAQPGDERREVGAPAGHTHASLPGAPSQCSCSL